MKRGTDSDSAMKRTEDTLAEKDEMLRKLSTPLVEVWEGIMMLPLIGILDSARAKEITESILEHIAQTKTDIVILSIGGITTVDTKAASHILRTAQAVKLMGSEFVITGMRPDVAVTLVSLGVDLSGIVTQATLHEGLEYSFAKLGWKVTKTSTN
jgi:rsbT co-antagonist protein RsbR